MKVDRIKEVEPEQEEAYDNFDDYPSDLELNFEEHPYIRDERPVEPLDYLPIEVET